MINNSVVDQILCDYSGETPAILKNLRAILTCGKLSGTGKMIILPVDQGFEHGPEKSFAPNPCAYDPHYHFKLAIDAGLSAYAAPLGMLSCGAAKFAGQIPLILKMNHSNSLNKSAIDQGIVAQIQAAVRLGCVGVGFTIYPGSDHFLEMLEELSILSEEAREYGLITVVWSYARGPELSKDDETSMDVISYAAHMAALAGAHIIKVKLATNHIKDKSLLSSYPQIDNQAKRVEYVKRSCFDGRRLVVFSGGASKDDEELFNEVKAIKAGGGNGSIIGRNTFQRKYEDALQMLDKIINIYKEQN